MSEKNHAHNQENPNEMSAEDIVGPPKVTFQDSGLITMSAFVSAIMMAIFFIILMYVIPETGQMNKTEIFFSFMVSIVAFFGLAFGAVTNFLLNRLLNPEKYGQSRITIIQIILYSILVYVFMLPLYGYTGQKNPEQIVIIFNVHVLLHVLGSSILVEVLANYRYVLLGIYGSFIGCLTAIMLSFFVYILFGSMLESALFFLVASVVVANTITHGVRSIFEAVYYLLYSSTGADHLGDVFEQIEQEEKDLVEEAKEKLEKFE